MPQNAKALVTIVIGREHAAMWARFAPSWRAYAERHGYDIVVIDRAIDPGHGGGRKSPHWQKCLILEHPEVKGYEDVVWIDCDIVVNHRAAPCIVAANGGSEKVGAVLHNRLNRATPRARTNREDRLHAVSEMQKTERYGLGHFPEPHEMYARAGLGDDVHDWINTGVMVFKPRLHAEFMRHIYDTRRENAFSLFDNYPVSYDLLRADLVNHVDDRFNADYLYEMIENYPFLLLRNFAGDSPGNIRVRTLCALTILANNWFIHAVAGAPGAREDLMRLPPSVLAMADFERFLRLGAETPMEP